MDTYEHTQPGTLTRILLGLVLVVPAVQTVRAADDPESAMVLGGTTLIIAGMLAAFHALTIRVSLNEIEVLFGIGLPRKTFLVRDIVSTSIVRNRWYNGWGIKRFRGGWLYNVSGFDAVELELANGSKARLGTDKPQELLSAINLATIHLNNAQP
jgi:hypothetical protein